MSSINSVTSSLASSLFSKLDTKKQGYIEKSDLQSAFDQLSASNTSSSTASVDQVFGSLDANSDGKVTQSELSSSLQKLADQLESQFNNARMSQAMGGQGGMPPPPPPSGSNGQDDAGFTKDQLTAQLSDIGTSDSKRSSLISNIVNNFSKADTDGDGKVTMKEAMAYDQASKTTSATTATAVTSTSSADSSGTSSSSTSQNEFAVMMRIMQLAQSYGSFGDTTTKSSNLTAVA